MKKLLISLGILLVPLVAGAAFNDVSLGTSAIISINDSLGSAVNLTVSGSADVVESITVGSTSFSVTLQSGSTLTVASAGRNLITTNAPDANEIITCGTSESSVALTATEEVTISVSVSPNACGGTTSSSSSGGGNGSVAQNGGGGGGSTYVAPTTTTVTSTNTTTIEQLQAMIASLMAQIAALGGTPSATPGVAGFTFTRNLKLGDRHSDVLNLQKVLNSSADTQVTSSGGGSPGNETMYFGGLTKTAVMKFQTKYGISPVAGFVGAITRAKLNSM
jgi:hypothetical protein